MESLLDRHLLSLLTFAPVGGAGVLLCLGLAARALPVYRGLPVIFWQVGGLVASGATLLLAIGGLWLRFDPETIGFQAVEYVPWLPEYGVHYFMGVDGISLLMVMLTALLIPLALLASWRRIDRQEPSFVVLMLALESGLIGTFLSLNLLQFYLFWEVMLIPMYFIIGIWGGAARIRAATKFFIFTMLGSLLMLVAMIVLYRLNFEQGGVWNFDLVAHGTAAARSSLALLETDIPIGGEGVPWWSTQFWLFLGFAIAFAIKVPMVPFHTWLPDAHVEAPTAGSVVLAGVLLKVGVYGFLRFALPLFPNAAIELTPIFIGLALVGIVYGSLIAMVQRDVKRLVAYSSVAHLGFVMLGVFSMNVHGLTGAVVQMLNHGLSTAALFLLVGVIYERRQTRDITDFGGLAKPMPVFATVLGIVIMSSIGLPGLNGFVGEFLILLGSFEKDPRAATIACLGIVLAAAYMLSMHRRIVFGPVDHPENRGLIDLDRRERTIFVALLLPIFWIGLYPNPVIRRVEPAVLEVLRHVDERMHREPAVPDEAPPPALEPERELI
jgi:NADH-quinone oxidoreductase subunit M